MRLKLQASENVAERVYDGALGYNAVIDVPVGADAVYIRDGAVEAVLGEGSSTVNAANPFKALTRCKERQQIYVVNRTKQFETLWGTGGIPFSDRSGKAATAGANGSYAFAVDNPSALLRKFGFPEVISVTDVKMKLKPEVTGAVKEAVMAAIESGVYNVGAKTDEIRVRVQEKLERVFNEYGLFLDVIRIEEVTGFYGGGDGEEAGSN